jgi:hypothetical protein
MSDLLDLALDGHGGLDRWQALKNITATLTARGALFTAKGHPDGLSTAQATAEVTTPRLTFRPFAGAPRVVSRHRHRYPHARSGPSD